MKEPTKILFTIPNFITAGSGKALLNIIERLNREKFEPAVCVIKKGGDLDRIIDERGILFLERPFTIPALPYKTLLIRAKKVAEYFGPFRFKLWHSFHYLDDYTEAIIARLAGAKAWIYTKKNMNWHRRSWYVRTFLASRVIAQNSDMMNKLFSNPLWRKKVRFIPRGVDTQRFRPDIPPRLNMRKKLGISSEDIVITCVAHLVPVKGHPTLLNAMARLPHGHLWLAGKPLDEAYVLQLESQIEKLGLNNRVYFLGNIKDIPALLAETDIFVLPTWAKWRMEGCPVALLEAMACGKPCIATDIPGSRDIIENGKSGLLVLPGDVEALEVALKKLLASSQLRNQFGKVARKRILNHFTIEHEVSAHEALYEEVLGL